MILPASLLAGILVFLPTIVRRLLPRQRSWPPPSFVSLLHGAGVGLYLLSGGILYCLILRPLYVARFGPDLALRSRHARRFLYHLARWLSRDWPMRDCERIWINADPASLAGPSVIVANHLSSFDVIILLGLTPDLVLVANRRVLRLPLLGTLARDAGHLAAGPGENQSLITAGLARLRQGISVALFPEGTRSRDGEIHRFHNGAFTLAQAAKCDIVPVLLTNTHACVYPHTRWLGYHRCIVRILPRISPATHAGVSPRALARRVRDLMAGYRPGDWRRSQEGPSFPRYIRSLYNYQSFKVQREVKRQLRSDPACAEIDALVPASGMVLVISCGYGVVCHILARKSPERQVLGVDSDPQRIAIAQSSALAIGRARFESIDARTWNWPPADCVVLLEGLRPWPQSDWPKMISSLAQSLCPQGTLIVPRNDSCLALLGEHKLSPARPSSGEAASSSSFVVVRLADN